MDKSRPTPKDPDFNLSDVDYQAFLPFRWHAKKHGHLIKRSTSSSQKPMLPFSLSL